MSFRLDNAYNIHEIEANIIRNLELLEQKKKNLYESLIEIENNIILDFFILVRLPASKASPEFLFNPSVISYVQKIKRCGTSEHPLLHDLDAWYYVAVIIANEETFYKLEKRILKLVRDEDRDNVIFHLGFYDLQQEIVRCVYLSQHSGLIDLYRRHFPLPKIDIFRGYGIPELFEEKLEKSNRMLCQISKKYADQFDLLEDKTIKIQRIYRKNKRRLEEVKRIAKKYFISYEDALAIIRDASKPYLPKKCSSKLAARIVSLAAQTNLFEKINHHTSSKHLTSIFDEGLYGRRTLNKGYYKFQSASLQIWDVLNGDGNVICFGPNLIDEAATDLGLSIKLDMRKLPKNNPCLFYKQADFGLTWDRVRTLKLGDSKLHFTHTNRFKSKFFEPTSMHHVVFQLLQNVRTFGSNSQKYAKPDADVIAVAKIVNASLIAYNNENMQQILTLNFFRFIDNLEYPDGANATPIIREIYSQLEKMDDQTLLAFLHDAGTSVTDTTEVNFYGSHLIDFDTVESISSTNYNITYVLKMQDLITHLQAGDVNYFTHAIKELPQAFASYRLLDYLLSKITNSSAQDVLTKHREQQETPLWKRCEEEIVLRRLI